MKKIALLFLVFGLISCKSAVKKEVYNSASFEKMKNVGIIFRLPVASKVTREEISSNFTGWLNGYKQEKKIVILPNVPLNLSEFSGKENMFFQLSADNDYQKQQTIGFIKQYAIDNSAALQEYFDKEKLDLLLIYEIESVFSKELQTGFSNNLVVMLNNKLELVHLTRQRDNFEEPEINFSDIKPLLIDKISNRLIDEFLSLGFISKI